MNPTPSTPRARSSPWATSALRERLLAARTPAGHWEGELSSSPLSTATAVTALTLAGGHEALVRGGLRWLAAHQNPDGGFGDADGCPSNISTTTLAWATLGQHRAVGRERAEAWLSRRVGPLTAESLAAAITHVYGDDRTFAVPILTHCALAGRFGWEHVPVLPFELAALPHAWFKWVGLPVVSYALPALIAIGQAQHRHHPTASRAGRAVRDAVRARTLRILESIQPSSGGFLEAAPLTSFVTMALAGSGLAGHPVARQGVAFLTGSVRDDGSWPIDTNLATWLTTLSINALGGAAFTLEERRYLRRWLLDQQYRVVHPYTQSAPGGWAWTDLPGGVPDGDDTPGALLALAELAAADDGARRRAGTGEGAGGERAPATQGATTASAEPGRPGTERRAASSAVHAVPRAGRMRQGSRRGLPAHDAEILAAAAAGVGWLIDLQNDDGGVPTFCRGWGRLVRPEQPRPHRPRPAGLAGVARPGPARRPGDGAGRRLPRAPPAPGRLVGPPVVRKPVDAGPDQPRLRHGAGPRVRGPPARAGETARRGVPAHDAAGGRQLRHRRGDRPRSPPPATPEAGGGS